MTENFKEELKLLRIEDKHYIFANNKGVTITLLIYKDKPFKKELKEGVVGIGQYNSNWLNDWETLRQEPTTEPKQENTELNIVVPKNCEDYRQFHTDKRTALMCSIDLYKNQENLNEEDIIRTAKYFLAELNNNFGGKKEK